MTSIYPTLLQQLWKKDGELSAVERLQIPVNNRQEYQRNTRHAAPDRAISRMSYEEEQYEKEMAGLRNFGAHWLRPCGILKTIEQAEDEEREVHESYEEYEDEDGEVNQNMADTDEAGQQGLTDELEETQGDSEADLDQDIEEGASFDADESFETEDLLTSAQNVTSDPDVVYGNHLPEGLSLSPSDSNRQTPQPNRMDSSIHHSGMSSAESGSIGDYSESE